MKHSLLKQKKQTGKWWLLALLLLTAYGSQAQTERSVNFKAVLDGSQNQLVANAEASVEDSVYFDPTLQGKLSTPYPVRNVVTFKVNEYSNLYLPARFNATANLHITYTLPDNTIEEVDQSLVINYDTGATYTARNSFVFNSAHRVKVKIVSVSSDAGTGILQALMLENEIQAQPEYILSCTDDAVKTISSNSPPNNDATDEITVSWPITKGADEYDLEWAYIDSTALLNNRYGTPLNRQLIFENNASRVSVKDNTYKIPLLYDNGGVLFFRVRAVQQNGTARIETAWSTDFAGGMGSYNFCGHQRALNWQSTISYAEEGKRKAVVQYYDGSLRSRQTVTKDNSTNTTLVSESFYDYQGRPVITVLPAPTLSSVIQYSRKFNQAQNGQEYDKDKYDALPDPDDFLAASAAPMSETSGANLYYGPSDENKDPDDGFNKFIPKANGYAFTETSYTQDNTGRISRQGGVGSTYKLGSNHETKYYYNTAAQKEIDALFGTEVGNEKHYFKNMVRDANGQYAVTYLDMHGRTIATALAGQPDSADLARLPSDVAFEVTDVLSGPGSNEVKDLVLESNKGYAVPIRSNYHFHYELTPPVLTKEKCQDGNACYNVVYDLEITITDDSNNQLLPEKKPVIKTVSAPGTFTVNCETAPTPIVLDFDVMLDPGSYAVTKRLSINREGLNYYQDSFLSSNNCKTLDDFIQEQRELQLNTQCAPTCQSCLDSLGTWENFRNNYMRRAGITGDTAAYRGDARDAFEGALEACNALCSKESQTDDVRRAMLMDMTAPSGQYANPDDAGNEYSIFNDPANPNPSIYNRGDIVYLDESGNPDMVYDQNSDSYVKPQQLSPDQFAAAFKSSWAEALLRFHPEYCRLLEYQKYEASNKWDREFETTDTYADAKAKGYLNPTANTSSAPFNNFSPALSPDPLIYIGDFRNQLENRLSVYKRYKISFLRYISYNMWSTATMMVKCNEGNSSCINAYMSPAEAFNESKMCAGDLDMAWRSFRQLYLQVKRELVNNQIKSINCQPSADKLLQVGKQPNFNDATAALDQNGLGYLNNKDLDVNGGRSKGQEELNKYYDDNCKAYSLMWIKQLGDCYNQAALDEIIPLLVQVCKEGSDQNHTTGASTVRPESTYGFKSFQAVLDDYNDRNNINDKVNCNADLITAPKPYNSQPAYGSKTTYTQPDDCECGKLNALRTEYLSYKKASDSNFATYIFRTRNVKIAQSKLDKLLSACNELPSGCSYLAEPLMIPAFMQCYVAPACATCGTVDSLYDKFTATYNVTPTIAEETTDQQRINRLFAGFMNNRLGFAKEAWEYLRFRDSCLNGSYGSSAGDSTVCVSTRQLMFQYSNGGTDVIYSIQKTSDNGYLLAGSTIANGGGIVTFAKTDASVSPMQSPTLAGKNGYLIKTDSRGKFQWARAYGGGQDDEFTKLITTNDGGFIAIGTTKSAVRDSAVSDIFIVKVDANGNPTWSKAIGFNTTYGERGNDIVQTSNGGYAFTGGYNYEAGTADWLVGTLSANGDLLWAKRLGTPRSDPTVYLTAVADTLVLSGSVLQPLETKYTGIVLKVNRNTGVVLNGAYYQLQFNQGNRSNWFGNIYKTPGGYMINVLDTDGFGSENGTAHIMNIKDNLSAVSAKWFVAASGMTGIATTPTSDGALLASLIWPEPQADVTLYKVDPNIRNTLTWSNGLNVAGNEYLYSLLQNADGSYAGGGMHDNKAMLVLPQASGKTGCQDSTLDASYYDANFTTYSYSPVINENRAPRNTLISLGMQSISVTEDSIGCHGFDSCYSISGSPLLCGNAEEVFSQLLPDTINNCSDNDFFAISTGTAMYHAYRDSLKGSFEQDYINKALKATELENFTVHYETREYHYTLYYYDQAGNLVKTIPPAGVVVDRSDTWLNKVKNARAAGTAEIPAHKLPTRYRYNTLNQMIAQITPDAGISRFWYDRLGRLAISQNAKQLAASPDRYSYTLYDQLGRITEVGEISSVAAMTDDICRSETALSNWISNAATNKSQITLTVYDVPHSPLEDYEWNPTNLRNRVSWTGFYNTAANLAAGTERASGTFYSYDILGNVNMLLQDYHLGPPTDNKNRFKKIVYDYDLVSGKVNKVSYQPGFKDQFYHRYSYDAENRLTDVQTSADGIYWENDAYYQYYKHGPLARMVLGQQQVQGLDYAYTLQGWLKGVNSSTLTPAFDMGHDGATGGITARDAFGFALHYFGERDYKPVNPNVHPFADAESAGSRFKPLFNGNIAMMSVNLPKVGEPLLYSYGYDVLNRLVKMDASRNLNTATNNWEPVSLDDYQERVSYDANGNILTYDRNGDPAVSGKPADMDRLTYDYVPNSNKLDHIVDLGNVQYDNDIKTQGLLNYDYDEIGNLVKDDKAGIKNKGDIEWTVYGKIKKIVKTNPDLSQTTITYDYDPAGNRISKNVNGHVTRYVRDASGNVMSVYQYGDPNLNGGKVTQTETHLYGSSRLGISTRETEVETSLALPTASLGGLESTSSITFVRDQKFFELGNHLGNVLATVSDVKKERSVDGSTVNHYEADLVSAQDYYPFGMLEPGRSWNAGEYRYGFNGKENDNEVKGEGNQIDFIGRSFDPRIGRWLSVDPKRMKSPGITPYRFGFNDPIRYKDPDGEWEEDGHYWTVYAMGIVMGLSKVQAQYVAAKAEYYDHKVHGDDVMTLHQSQNWPYLPGVGTWADQHLQGPWHGLTGEGQGAVLYDAVTNVLYHKDLNQLHKVGDAWAHSYVNSSGDRVMWGGNKRLTPLGRITLEHAIEGGELAANADNIADRPIEYMSYVGSLTQVFNDRNFEFNRSVKNSNPDLGIFDFVQRNKGDKETNIFLFQSFIKYKTGENVFATFNKSHAKSLMKYFDKIGVKYTFGTNGVRNKNSLYQIQVVNEEQKKEK